MYYSHKVYSFNTNRHLNIFLPYLFTPSFLFLSSCSFHFRCMSVVRYLVSITFYIFTKHVIYFDLLDITDVTQRRIDIHVWSTRNGYFYFLLLKWLINLMWMYQFIIVLICSMTHYNQFKHVMCKAQEVTETALSLRQSDFVFVYGTLI